MIYKTDILYINSVSYLQTLFELYFFLNFPHLKHFLDLKLFVAFVERERILILGCCVAARQKNQDWRLSAYFASNFEEIIFGLHAT